MKPDIDINYTASESWDDEMLARLMWLQANEPVYWSEKDQFWLVTRYEDVSYVSKKHEIFCSGQGVRPDGSNTKIGFIDEDEPRHGHMRKWINKGFTPRMVAKLEPTFRKIVTETIDAVAHRSECDFVDDLSVPMPLLLIAEMLGIHKEDRKRFHYWSDTMIAADGNQDNPEIMIKAANAYMEYANYLTDIFEDRRKNPQDDLISILVDAEEKGMLKEYDLHEVHKDRSEEDKTHGRSELVKLCVTLLVAGNETTRNAITGGMEQLIRNPDQRQRLIDDPSLIPVAVEEMLRHVTPVRSFVRTATRDTELQGQRIKKGQKVFMIYTAANRDPEQFQDPHRFDIARNPIHLGFGIGNHFCLGSHLARMEFCVALEELLRRLPDMEFSRGGPEFGTSALVRTCTHMWVKYTPEA